MRPLATSFTLCFMFIGNAKGSTRIKIQLATKDVFSSIKAVEYTAILVPATTLR